MAEWIDDFFTGPVTGSLSTCSKEGEVNAAVFGSMRRLEDGRFRLGLGRGRSLKYLRQNPRCVFLLSEPGANVLQWKGARLYLRATAMVEEGEIYAQALAEITEQAGAFAARQVKTVVLFDLVEARPLLAMGD